MIDATARLEHYVDHLAPTWRAIAPERRGTFWVPEKLLAHAHSRGIEEAWAYRGDSIPWEPEPFPILVAASQDVRRAARSGRPVAYQGHGIGQSFVTAEGQRIKGYSGGAGFEDVALFLATNERHAALWRAAYPQADVEVVGSPKLGGRTREAGPRGTLVVASFHWRCRLLPEAGTAWDHYRRSLAMLAGRFDFALHAHPRIRKNVRREAQRIGVEFIASFDEVLERAAVYVNDCSSTLWEFAAFGGPVVVLNAPAFRRDVHHGLRFWDCADVGPQVQTPAGLVPAIQTALVDPASLAARRREISAELYPHDDPAERAAQALARLHDRAGDPAPAH